MKMTRTYAIIDAVVRCGSFRKAAEEMAITSTALNRRVIAFEEEIGVTLFERLPHGVKPTVAGEIFVDHVRKFLADLNRVQSTIADLSGVRRGHVSIATSIQISGLLPNEISAYRRQHPGVTFSLDFMKMPEVEAALLSHTADMAIVLGGLNTREFQTIHTIKIPISVIMPISHALASNERISMGDCAQYPVALPAPQMGVREIINDYCKGREIEFKPVIESNHIGFLLDYIRNEELLTFLVPPAVFGHKVSDDLIVRPISGRDAPHVTFSLTQLRGKVLSVAAAKFAAQISMRLVESFVQTDSQ